MSCGATIRLSTPDGTLRRSPISRASMNNGRPFTSLESLTGVRGQPPGNWLLGLQTCSAEPHSVWHSVTSHHASVAPMMHQRNISQSGRAETYLGIHVVFFSNQFFFYVNIGPAQPKMVWRPNLTRVFFFLMYSFSSAMEPPFVRQTPNKKLNTTRLKSILKKENKCFA